MLWVGRELYIEGKIIICRACLWNGCHHSLQTGLIQMRSSKIHLVAYRCPECSGFDLGIKGKLLSFNLQTRSANPEDHNPLDTSPAEQHHHGYTEKRDSR